MPESSPQEIDRIRSAILLEMLPNVAIASFADTIARELRRRHGLPQVSEADVTRHLQTLETLGKVQRISPQGAQTAALKGWQLTASGVNAAEELAYA